MKAFKMLFVAILSLAAVSCVRDSVPGSETKEPGLDVFAKVIPDGYYAVANVTVPAATETVYIEYRDANGKRTTVAQSVSPRVIDPDGGKDAEPFGIVSLLLKSPTPTKVSVYYKPKEEVATKGSEEVKVPIVDDLPVSSVYAGEFGKTRYVQMTWDYGWVNSEATHWVNTRTYPADVVVYNQEHNHTLLYRYVYSGVNSEGYMLDEAYEIEDHVAKKLKYKYCNSCGDGCQFCMPWGCTCGCGGFEDDAHTKPILNPNPNFHPNGNKVEEYLSGGAATEAPQLPVNVVDVPLQEPATYVTTDGDYTNYHSSGVVMFDDSWPNLPQVGVNGSYIMDYNDMVVDYDIEAVTVADELLATEGYREQVKVVLHIRALGSKSIYRVGMSLDNFNTEYVESVSEYKTLDSWQNEHGELPEWARSTRFQENSIHYDAVSGTEFERNTNRPAVEIGKLQAFNGEAFMNNTWPNGAGKHTYTYVGDHGSVVHVMNPALKVWEGWPSADESQYDPALADVTEPETLASMQKFKFYNTVPGYVNVAGGLYTYTVIYHMKPRAEMGALEREAAKQNMIEAVMNNMAQNFFVVKKDFAPIGLKGYQPLDYKTKDNHVYANEYTKFYKQNSANLNADIPYVGANGQVWAFKCPVLTRHTWERMYFSNAYPHYLEWVLSDGEESKDWYKNGVNYVYLSCEW